MACGDKTGEAPFIPPSPIFQHLVRHYGTFGKALKKSRRYESRTRYATDTRPRPDLGFSTMTMRKLVERCRKGLRGEVSCKASGFNIEMEDRHCGQ